ncbi:MAG TPA: GNAT family N-acetyltransferase [Candidatus Binatia bacterium]|nr:GNAT family N-acetyltransferase [Candidatus Binatia bacterium]
MSDYHLRPLDLSPAGLERLSALFGVVFPHTTHHTPAYLDWMYNRNPAGTAIGSEAEIDGRLVGHYVLIPLRSRVHGVASLGAHSLHGAVHPDHQGRRLYARLGELAHEAGARAGIRFIVGVPNANSTHVFARTFGFQLVCVLEARLGLGRVAHDAGGGAVDYERDWDAATVAWRLANPNVAYELRRRGGRCEVLAPAGRGIRAMLGDVDDALVPRPAGVPARPRPALELWIGADPALRWSRSLYVPIPGRLRPAPLNFVFKDLSGQGRTLDPRRLRYRLLDFDAY